MAIKVIDEIPKQKFNKTKREEIRADIQGAIDKGITLFEFEGDYNWKYLGQYAKEEADRVKAKIIHDIHRKFREENFTDAEKRSGFFVWFKMTYDYKHDFIHISTCKGEERRRVFCRIGKREDFEAKVIADCQKVLDEARAEFEMVDGKWRRKR